MVGMMNLLWLVGLIIVGSMLGIIIVMLIIQEEDRQTRRDFDRYD